MNIERPSINNIYQTEAPLTNVEDSRRTVTSSGTVGSAANHYTTAEMYYQFPPPANGPSYLSNSHVKLTNQMAGEVPPYQGNRVIIGGGGLQLNIVNSAGDRVPAY